MVWRRFEVGDNAVTGYVKELYYAFHFISFFPLSFSILYQFFPFILRDKKRSKTGYSAFHIQTEDSEHHRASAYINCIWLTIQTEDNENDKSRIDYLEQNS